MPVFTITRLTFLEAMRRRIALAAVVLGIAFLILYAVALYLVIHQSSGLPSGSVEANLIHDQVLNFLSLMGIYAVNLLTIVLGALISADTLAGEISSGTVQTMVTKPVRRADIVLGKWIGYAVLLGLYLSLMIGGVVLIVRVIAGYMPPNVASGVLLIFLESLVMMSLTIACSSTFSTLATGGIVFGLWGLAFIGGFVEQIGALIHNTAVVNVGIISSLILPTEAVFRRAAYIMTPPLAQSLGFANGPLFVVSVPSPAMIVYAALYLLVLVALAVRQFSRRDL